MSLAVPFHSKENKGRSSVHAKNRPSNVSSKRDLHSHYPPPPPGGTTNPLGITKDLQIKDLSLGGGVVAKPQLTLRGRPGHTKGKGKGKGKGPLDEQTLTFLPEENKEATYLKYTPAALYPNDYRPPIIYTYTSKEEEPPHAEICPKCRTEHHPSSFCPVLPCKICFDPHHESPDCPFNYLFPKGAVFDQDNYEIICQCHFTFNEAKWVCTRCDGTTPKLQPKYCDICKKHTQHLSHECTKDKVKAAWFKQLRDQELTRKKIYLDVDEDDDESWADL